MLPEPVKGLLNRVSQRSRYGGSPLLAGLRTSWHTGSKCSPELSTLMCRSRYTSIPCRRRSTTRRFDILDVRATLISMRRVSHFELGSSYSVPEAAALAGVPRSTLARWVKQGRVRASRVGHSYVISGRELAPLLPRAAPAKRVASSGEEPQKGAPCQDLPDRCAGAPEEGRRAPRRVPALRVADG
jgi:excisionase family DNA binding protein